MTAPTLPAAPAPAGPGPIPMDRAARPRRLATAAHVIVSSGWLGLSVAMVTLAIGAALSADPTFAAVSYDLIGRIRRHRVVRDRNPGVRRAAVTLSLIHI